MNKSSSTTNQKLTLDRSKLKVDKLRSISLEYQSVKTSSNKAITTIEIRKSKNKSLGVDVTDKDSFNLNNNSQQLTLKEQMYRISALQNAQVNNKKHKKEELLESSLGTDNQIDENNSIPENIHADQEKSAASGILISPIEKEFSQSKKSKKYEEKDFEEKKSSLNKRIIQNKYDKNLKLLIEDTLSDHDRMSNRPVYNRKTSNKKVVVVKKKIHRKVLIPNKITVQELANRMSERVTNVLKVLSEIGENFTASSLLDASLAQDIVLHFNHTFKLINNSDIETSLYQEFDKLETITRPPVVTVMGHVDHGKTSLLDAIRKTSIVTKEFGGITQHIGAYQVTVDNDQLITFIDTPGHEAFTAMRSRGANITDIVVLVVAADDGIMPQTIEAINHAKAAGVVIIVAINKIDKPNANIEKITNDLLQYEIIPESLGGDVIIVPVSAQKLTNLNELKDSILLVAELLELKAPINCRASGVVIESKIDKSRGVLITLIVQKGKLKVGDIITIGNNSYGKVRNMFNERGKRQKEALPSTPVEILGINNVPQSGDEFIVVDSEKQAKELISHRLQKAQEKLDDSSSLENYSLFNQNMTEKLNIILKCDVMGSVEAIYNSINKLKNEELKINFLHKAVGNVTDSDVILAESSNAIILAFNVKVDSKIKDLAKQKNIDIRSYSIIYDVIDDVKSILTGMLKPSIQQISIGTLSIKQIFSANKNGSILGCYVTNGIVKRNATVKLLHKDTLLYEGKIKALKRFKDDVKEVNQGFECGILLQYHGTIDPEIDTIEVFELVEEIRAIQ